MLTISVLIFCYALSLSIIGHIPLDAALFKEILGFGANTSSTDTSVSNLLPGLKWLTCYTVYVFIVLSPVLAIGLWYLKRGRLRFNRELCVLCAILAAALIFVAARHSEFVGYNADGAMMKLIVRYVTYILPLTIICLYGSVRPDGLGRVEKCSGSKLAVQLAVGLMVCIFGAYMLLYQGLVWQPDAAWLSYARGQDSIGYLVWPILTLLLYLCVPLASLRHSQTWAICLSILCFFSSPAATIAYESQAGKAMATAVKEMMSLTEERNIVIITRSGSSASTMQVASNFWEKYTPTNRPMLKVALCYNKNSVMYKEHTIYALAVSSKKLPMDSEHAEVLGWRLEPLEPYSYADGEGLIAGPAEQVAKGSYRYLLSMDVSDLSDIDACIVIDENSGCFLPVSRKDGHIELFSSEIKWNKPVMLYDCISHTKRRILPGGV